MKRLSKWMWFVGILFLILLVLCIYWLYEYSRHSTPEEALTSYDSSVGRFKTIPFAKGVVLLTPSGQRNGLTAWYMKKGFLGWRVRAISNVTEGLATQNYNVDFQSFTLDDETFVWGTSAKPIKEILYSNNGKTYVLN
jgi:Ca2+/Na+ antiporter